MLFRYFTLLIATTLLFMSQPSWAADTSASSDEAAEKSIEQCFSAYEQAQVQLKKKDYIAAQSTAQSCSESCPAEIIEECKGLRSQAERESPTAMLFAQSEKGGDAPNIVVSIDGKEVSPEALLDEISLNPGPHSIRFSRTEDGWQEDVDIVLRRGEKRHQVRVVVPPVKQGPDPLAPTPPPIQKSKRGIHPAALSAFIVGGAGFATAATAGIVALVTKGQLDDCAGHCSSSLVNSAHTWITVADVGLIVGAVGVLTGTGLVIWGPKKTKPSGQAVLQVLPTPGGAAGLVTGTF